MYLSRDSSDASQSTTNTDDSSSTTTTSTSTPNPPNTPSKEPVVPQRVTRSSQRYAQLNGENQNESRLSTNGSNADHDAADENAVVAPNSTSASNNADRIDQSGRKAKRKKLEQQADSETDTNQQGQQALTFVPDFCPADYQLPEFNSFELYKRQKRKLHKEIMCLGDMQVASRAPDGIDDYLLFNGPYLLDGDKFGIGLGVASVKRSSLSQYQQQVQVHQQLPSLKMKFSRTRSGAFKLLSSAQHQLANNQKLKTYNIPQIMEAPKVLANNSPLHELFQTQEKARQKMRMQHLKERERSIMATEQEILRAYKQQSNLSACAYFSLQEKYHYIHDKAGGTCENLDYPTTSSMVASQDRQQITPNSLSSQKTERNESGNALVMEDTNGETSSITYEEDEQKVIRKLVKDLQALDDKWADVKREMFIRHKNESDTLYAIQSLEWDWRAKETGACEKEFVPRVEVPPLEY